MLTLSQTMKKVRWLMVILSVLLIPTLLGLCSSLSLLSRRPTPSRWHSLRQSYTKEAGKIHPSFHVSFRLVNVRNTSTLANYSTTAQRDELIVPFMGDYNCSDDICSQFLTSAGKYKCTAKHNLNFRDIEKLQKNNGKCHFMDGSHRAPVGLISFPGSGNTWLRGLLEKATGICTGSVYCDLALKRGGFTGEGFQSGVVLAVKNHNPKIVWKNDPHQRGIGPPWGVVILVIRNPLDAIVAEWNRQKAFSHTVAVGTDYFGNDKAWEKFVKANINKWKQYFVSLVQNGIRMNRPFLIVRYEDIKSDALSQVKKIMNFLSIPVSDQLLQARITSGYETFLRSHPQEFEHYTPQQRKQVLKAVQEVVNMLQKVSNGSGDTFGIEDYINGTM